MLDDRYKKAIAELLHYLKGISEDEIDLIPNKLMEYLRRNADPEYICNFDYTLPLRELKLMDETKRLIGMLYLNYICESDDEKQRIIDILHTNELKYSGQYEELNYDISDIYYISDIFPRQKEKINRAFIIKNGVLKKYKEESGITEVVIPDSVTEIGNDAFYGCTSLISVTIPDSVTAIGDHVFDECWNLETINVSEFYTNLWYSDVIKTKWYKENKDDLIILGARLLQYKGNNSIITIPNIVTVIDWYAFSDCKSLTSVTIPKSVKEIGYLAFDGCTSLISVEIPSTVEKIESTVFSGCSSMISINVNLQNKIYRSVNGVLYNKKCTKLLFCPKGVTNITIPDTVTEISSWAFEHCKSMTSITIPDSVTKIGDHAFYGCTSLTSVTISDNVMKIGNRAFYGCNSLISVTILYEVTKIGDEAFCDCTSLTSITIPNGMKEDVIRTINFN